MEHKGGNFGQVFMNFFLIPPRMLTSLLVEGLDGFGTSMAGLEPNLFIILSQMKREEKRRGRKT